jgi:L-ascorbate metabolism protein UlaG (beta-lactamase superfamily)
MIDSIKWFGHGSFAIEGPPLIYIDPWRVAKHVFHPDAILVSHDHYESFSIADISKLRGPTTQILSNPTVIEQLDDGTVLRPWQSITIDRASIKAVPAYSPTSIRHPEEAGGLGFVISLNLYDIYYAGGTQIIPEMDHIHPDVAILPIDGDGTLTVAEAADVVRQMRPRWVLPSNWGPAGDGASIVEARQLQELVQDYAQVIIPEPTR